MKMKKITFVACLSLAAATIIGISSEGFRQMSAASDANTPVLTRQDGYVVRFKANPNASKYVVNDTTDYRNGLVLTNADADDNGYIYYETETVGVHNVSVTAYINSNTYKSNTLTVTNKPVFFYGTPSSLSFFDVTGAEHDDEPYYSIYQTDGTYKIVSQSQYNSDDLKNQYNAVDFSREEYVYEIIDDMKDAGANVLFLHHRIQSVEESTNTWWFKGFDNSVVKRFMDAAWESGMKCVINDFIIQTVEESADTDAIKRRLDNKELRKALMHPAFYGLNFADEPAEDKIANVGISVKYIMDYWKNDAELKNRPLPYIHTALRSYDENKSDEFGYFTDATDYKNYIKSWITNTGLNYFNFDTYTYTTRVYGIKKLNSSGDEPIFNIGGTTYRYDPSKVIYDAINLAEEELGKDIEVYQVCTASTDESVKAELTADDVFASALLARGQGVSGHSFYEYKFSESSGDTLINKEFKLTDTYKYVKEVNKQLRKMDSILEGYTATNKTIPTYGKWPDKQPGWGPSARIVQSTFVNDADPSKTYSYTANFESHVINTTYNVTVPEGKIYYLFGYDYKTHERVGTGASVTINNGEAILISSESAKTIVNTSFNKDLLCDYDVVTIKDFANVDGFDKTTGFSTESLDIKRLYQGEKSDNGSVAIRFNYTCDSVGGQWDWGPGLIEMKLGTTSADQGYYFAAGVRNGLVFNGNFSQLSSSQVLIPGQDNIVEFGAIKIKNSLQTYVYTKVNDEVVIDNIYSSTNAAGHEFTENYIHMTSSASNLEKTNAAVSSVNLKRHSKNLGKVDVYGGNSTSIYLSAANDVEASYKLASNSTESYTNQVTGNVVEKTGYMKYKVSLKTAATAGTTIDLSGLYFNFNNGRKTIEIPNTTLYFNGSEWVDLSIINQVQADMALGFECAFKGNKIISESFRMKFSIDDSYSNLFENYDEFGIKVYTKSKTMYFTYENTHYDSTTNERYVIIDLGKAISENHYNDVFTVAAYAKKFGQECVSTKTMSGSIYTMVCDLYNNPSTSSSVSNLYNYLNQ